MNLQPLFDAIVSAAEQTIMCIKLFEMEYRDVLGGKVLFALNSHGRAKQYALFSYINNDLGLHSLNEIQEKNSFNNYSKSFWNLM